MKTIPTAPLILALAGLIPFIWGAVTTVLPSLALWSQSELGGRLTGPYIQLFYGAVILSFMSGVLWGFATKSDLASNYVVSVVPALWAFFMTGAGPVTSAVNLIVGFLAVLIIDWHMSRQGLTPNWWMTLRIAITAVVVVCIGVIAV